MKIPPQNSFRHPKKKSAKLAKNGGRIRQMVTLASIIVSYHDRIVSNIVIVKRKLISNADEYYVENIDSTIHIFWTINVEEGIKMPQIIKYRLD